MLDTLRAKDDVCRAFEDYLGAVDDDYVRLVTEQQAEVDEVVRFARQRVRDVQERCKEAAKGCEEAFDEERNKYI